MFSFDFKQLEFYFKNISATQYIKRNITYDYNFGFPKTLTKLCIMVKKCEDMAVETASGRYKDKL